MAEPDALVIKITDEVLVEDTKRLGINLGDDAYYSGAALVKDRARENFEGTSYRQCHFGPMQDEQGITTWFKDWGDWDKQVLPGARFTILSGPAKGSSGTIKKVETRQVKHKGKMEDFRYFVFDRKLPAGPANVGVLIERSLTDDGQFRPLDGYWTSKQNRIKIGDVPPGSFGNAAALLDGSQLDAHLRFATQYQRFGQCNGNWNIHFWAKAVAKKPSLRVGCDPSGFGNSANVEPTSDWKKYELVLAAKGVPEPKSPKDNPMLFFRFDASDGQVLLDDVEIWRDGDTNPTVFRDDCVAILKEFQPGIVRRLQMGGSTLDNTLAPPLESFSYTSQNSAKVGPYEQHGGDSYSLHQMYELCEHLGCDPWFCLPGTLQYDEMKRFMEYLAAPADVGYGRRRAELGHPRPWTEVFEQINVEFGNEAWNNAPPYQCGGFNGDDYWKDLIAIGKKSPYYKKNIVFHGAGQATNSWLTKILLKRFPNADRFALAPYILHDFSKAEAEALDTDDKLFRWASAVPIWRVRNEEGSMYQAGALAKAAGIEMSIYEFNYHITGGDGPLEPRNRLVTSIAGGVNVANSMLLMMREQHVRDQCLFSLTQHHFNANGIGPVRLWGTALCMRKGARRYRPTFLACAAANRAIGGSLLRTRHVGRQPTFSATGIFRRDTGVETVDGIPDIWSYAFALDEKRSLVLINLSTSKTHAITLDLPERVDPAGAQSWLLAADRITANNEYEIGRPRVELRQQTLPAFRNGWKTELTPASMRVLQWNVERTR